MRLIILISIFAFATILLIDVTKRVATVENDLTENRFCYSKRLVILFAVGLIILGGFRYDWSDTGNYKGLFKSMAGDFDFLWGGRLPYDWGFGLFTLLFYHITSNEQVYILICTAIIVGIEVYYLTIYSCDLGLALYLYFINNYMGSLNGIRQGIAAAILSLAFPLLLRKKTVSYFLVILLLAPIHKSVLLMIPLYFIISGRRMNTGVYGFLLVCGLSLISLAPLNALLSSFIDEEYAGYFVHTGGMSLGRLLVAISTFILALLFSRVLRLKHIDNRFFDVLVNMEMICFGFTLLGFKLVYYARCSMYLRSTSMLIIPLCLKYVFDGDSSKNVRIIIIVLYFIFHVIQIRSYQAIGMLDVFRLNF